MNLARKELETLPMDRAADPVLPYRPNSSVGPVPSPPEPPTGADIGRLWNTFKYNWLLFVVLGSMLGAGLAYAAWSLIPSKYSTYALVRVSSGEPFYLYPQEGQASRTDFLTYLKTQAKLLTSNYVITAALRDPAVKDLPMLKEQVDPVRFLEEELKVEYQDGNEIVRLILAGDDAQQIKNIVDAVVNAYFKEIIEEEKNRKQRRLAMLEDLRASMQKNLMEKRDKRNKKMDKLDESASPNAILENSVFGPSLVTKMLLASFEQARSNEARLLQEIEAASMRIKMLVNKIEGIDKQTFVIPPTENFENDPEVIKQTQLIEALTQRINRLKNLSSDPNALAIVAKQKELEKAVSEKKRLIADRVETANRQARDLLIAQERARLNTQLDDERSRLALLEQSRPQAADEVKRLEDELKKTPAPVLTPNKEEKRPTDFPTFETESQEQKIQRLIEKIQELKVEADAPARVRPLQAASIPLKKDGKKQMMGTAMAGLMGFVLVGVGLIGLEARKMRTYSLKDVRDTNWPVLGVIPWSAELSTSDNTGYATRAGIVSVNEAIDKMRSLVLRDHVPGRCKAVMVTSAVDDEGKSFVAWQLAQSISRAGAKTLLIDFDLRTPSMHDYLRVPNANGVCELLCGELDLRRATHTFSNGLAFLPAGIWTDRVREEMVGERLAELLRRCKEAYDIVVIHGHAYLPVTDAMIVATHADTVILSTLKFVTTLPLLQRAQERIEALGTCNFGTVYVGATSEECLY